MTIGSLAAERYISLTTFKRDGAAVSTPVWVVSDDGHRLLVWSASSTWKVRRLRRDSRVLVAPCTFRGKERGERREGRARVVDGVPVGELLRAKYGWQKRALDLVNRNGDPSAWVTVEISEPEISEP